MTAAPDKLLELGWDDSWAELAAACPTPGLPGRVTRVDRGVCTVMTEHGPVRASWSGALLDAAATDPTTAPCTGDWCVLSCWPDGPVTIQSVLDRRTAVIRADANRTSLGQVLVANVDLIAVVVALHPEPNISRIERLMTLAWESGARPIVVLTKLDLVPDGAGLAAEVRAACPGVDVVACSTVTGAGLDEVRALIGPTGTVGLIGASGHGKSTLTNALVGAEVLTTKQIRDDGKGRHTSVRRELVPLPGGGSVIDTPGLRGVGLSDAPAGLAATFPDIEELAGQCKFRDCSHDSEPGCAIRTAIADGRLAERRLDSWFRLQRELAHVAARSDARLRSEQVKKWKKITQQHRTPRRGR
ncbi:MAG: ribosome small subunit-dependent GTPase A [Nocardioidaceae bacterium]